MHIQSILLLNIIYNIHEVYKFRNKFIKIICKMFLIIYYVIYRDVSLTIDCESKISNWILCLCFKYNKKHNIETNYF